MEDIDTVQELRNYYKYSNFKIVIDIKSKLLTVVNRKMFVILKRVEKDWQNQSLKIN